ncbi:MAG: CinA family protein [Deltaproteobacteria bacterium]|jgi:PncC family amidohydrolase|nr:CinA family protein [Deltaproteobacteria bacterium]
MFKAVELVNKILKSAQGRSFGFAESCSGGRLAAAFTAVPSISSIFKGSLVVYSNQAKENILGIDSGFLNKYGAVSYETALLMALKTRKLLDCDISSSITGYAGPGGREVGKIFISISTEDKLLFQQYQLSGSRVEIQNQIVLKMLENLLKIVNKEETDLIETKMIDF